VRRGDILRKGESPFKPDTVWVGTDIFGELLIVPRLREAVANRVQRNPFRQNLIQPKTLSKWRAKENERHHREKAENQRCFGATILVLHLPISCHGEARSEIGFALPHRARKGLLLLVPVKGCMGVLVSFLSFLIKRSDLM
jgi:hypothetical protein